MKIRLLALAPPVFSPFYLLLLKRPSYTQSEGGQAGFAKPSHSNSASIEEKPLFKKSDTVFTFSSDLKYRSDANAERYHNFHYASSLNV